jgi:hypothetical protein
VVCVLSVSRCQGFWRGFRMLTADPGRSPRSRRQYHNRYCVERSVFLKSGCLPPHSLPLGGTDPSKVATRLGTLAQSPTSLQISYSQTCIEHSCVGKLEVF